MTGLTRVAITARKSIRYGIYFIVFISIGKVLLDASVLLYKKIFPAPPPPATVKYGKLASIAFPKKDPSPKLTYVLETPEGGLPTNIPTQAKVFFMPKINPSLLALDVAKEKAKTLGFPDEPEQLSETLYKFTSPHFPSNLEMNIVKGTFSISYDLTRDRSPLEVKPPVAEVGASEFRAILSSANILPADLNGPTLDQPLKLSDGKFIIGLSLSESDVIKVNLFRKPYDNMPSLTASPSESNVWAIISGSRNREQQIIAAEYHYHPVDESQFSTYPVKTPEQAFNELQSGTTYVADLGVSKDGATMKIRKIYLAYFDPEEPSDFYQPIYVFEGDNGFTAYTPAVIGDYYGSN